MLIEDNFWEEPEEGQVHSLPGLCPLDVDKGMVEQANFMGSHIIQVTEIQNISACPLKWAIFIRVHLCIDDDTLPTDEPQGEFLEILTEFLGLFSVPPYHNSQQERQADFEIQTDSKGKTPIRSLYCISPWEEDDHSRGIDMAIHCRQIQLLQTNFSPPVLFIPQPDSTLWMCIDYCTVKP